MKLVIVESPTKARTIGRFLDKEYHVLSSYGHIRDLPTGKLGVDVEKNFSPDYVIPPKAKKNLSLLKTESKKATKIILATDEDREGEAIAYHLKHVLGGINKKVPFERITFHEITPLAIKEALKHPREIDVRLFEAQQTRRILDRLVGYELSPFLWKKIRKGLSAGRVQSVAVRLIVEREREREKFKSEEFWKIKILWKKQGEKEQKETLEIIKESELNKLLKIKEEKEKINGSIATLVEKNGKKLNKLSIKEEKESQKILDTLCSSKMEVTGIEKKRVFRQPSPPFRTSTLQQEAGRRLGFSAKRTMMTAQQLYEGISVDRKQVGLITYMRTDSLTISASALNTIKEVINKNFGPNYSLQSPRYFKNKAKGAQEAHEAIRPSFPEKTPDELKDFLSSDQYKLYRLIWEKTIGSQMAPAELNTVKIKFRISEYGFLSEGSQIVFDGFMKVLGKGILKEELLPEVSKGEKVDKRKLFAEQNFTKPPARYTEASLIKALEENGIGRPSTYAPTISTIQDRGYVSKDDSQSLFPNEIGCIVNDSLVEHFPNIVEIKFTASVEEDLDKIASGKEKWVPVVSNFYKPFKKNLLIKDKEVSKFQKLIDKKCPECGKQLVEKFGRFGKFYACSGYPECKHSEGTDEEKQLEKEVSAEKCPECGHPLTVKRSKWGMFKGCSNYPNCKFIKKFEKTIGIKCPECKTGDLVEKRGKRGPFYACNQYPKCKYIAKGRPGKNKCEKCGQIMMRTKEGEHCLNCG